MRTFDLGTYRGTLNAIAREMRDLKAQRDRLPFNQRADVVDAIRSLRRHADLMIGIARNMRAAGRDIDTFAKVA